MIGIHSPPRGGKRPPPPIVTTRHLELPSRPPDGLSAHPGCSSDSGELRAEQKQKPAGLLIAFQMQSSPGGGWGAGPGPSCDVNLTLRRQPSASPADAGSGSPSREGGPAASRPAPGRLGRWARGGRYINPERDGREAGGEEAGRLRQTPQLKSESELAVRAAPRRPTTRRTVPGDGDPRGAPSLYSPRLHPRPAATFPCKPQTRGHRRARSAQEGVLEGGRVGPVGDTPPPGNSLVWIFLDSYFGLCCCFPGEGGLQGEDRKSVV